MCLKTTLNSKLFLLFFLLSVTTFFSCEQQHNKPGPSGFADESFADKLSVLMKPVDTAATKKMRPLRDDVRLVYQLDDYQPIWVKANYASNDAAAKLIEELEDMRWDGVDPERYNLTAIKLLKTKLDTTKKNSVNDAIAFDTTLTRSFLAASKFLLLGEIQPKKVDSLWFHINDSSWNAPRLLVDNKERNPLLADFRSEVPTYELLRQEYKLYYTLASDSSFGNAIYNVNVLEHIDSEMLSSINYIIQSEMPWVAPVANDTMSDEAQLVRAYQSYKAIKPTGKFDSTTLAELKTRPDDYMKKLKANMERVRWMQRSFGDLYIVVDVPLMELFLRRQGVDAMHMRVVVGKKERQTPSLYATMANVVINPPWGVPLTILKNDVLPGLQKSGKQYMTKKGLKAYDHDGNIVNASSINMRNYRRYTYKQAPGDDNSLGYVKFNLPNPWDIYLHDTPHRDDFGKRFRALSSGCIRLQQPQEMALYILSELEKKYYTQGKLDTLIATHKTRWEILKNKIPVHIAYLTAFEDTTGKHIQFVRDVYGRDEKLMAMMK